MRTMVKKPCHYAMHPIFRPALPMLCLLLALPGCANNKAREEASRATVTISSDGKRLVYNGKIKAQHRR